MNTMDRSFDEHHGYVELGCKLLHGELNSTVRGASVPVIDLSQGEGASSDGGSSPHKTTARSVLLVSSDGSSYAAPSAGLVPDARIACVGDNDIAVSSDGSSYAAPSAGLVPDTRIACVSDNAIACAWCQRARARTGRFVGRKIDPAQRFKHRTSMPARLLRSYKGPVLWQQLNGRMVGSASHARYERYKSSRTIADAYAAGMQTGGLYIDIRRGYVKMGMQLFDGELDSTVRGASAPVIALWQGEGASSDGGSSPHEATPRSELLVSSDGSSYAAPSAGSAPDTRIARVSDNAIACARCQRARDRNYRFVRQKIGPARVSKQYTKCCRVKKTLQRRIKDMDTKIYNLDPMAHRNERFSRKKICSEQAKKQYTECCRVKISLQRRLNYWDAKLYNFDPMAPRLLRSYKGHVLWQQLNERIVGSAVHARYERYKSSRTFADASAAGMWTQDRRDDVRRGYVKADGCF
jgi:hypothetical protein